MNLLFTRYILCIRSDRYLRYSLLALILIAVAFAYGNVIQGEFQFDDDVFINDSLSSVGWASLFTPATLIGYMNGNRFLTLLSFAANYHYGGLYVSGYHITNIAIHACTTLLAFYFTTTLLRLKPIDERSQQSAFFPALCITTIFALHPLQTQAVSYIVQRSELLASFFYLACLTALLRFTVNNGQVAKLWWTASLIFFIAGWGCKEIIITVPLAYLLCIVYAGGKNFLGKARQGILPYCIGGVILIFIKLKALHGTEDAGFSSFAPGAWVYCLTQLKVIAGYLLMVIVPQRQNIDHDVATVDTLRSVEGALFFVAWLCTLSGCVYLLLKYQGRCREQLRSMAFGLLWALIILLPTSSFIPLRDVMFEHRMYLPLLGIAFALVSCSTMLAQVLFSPGAVRCTIMAVTFIAITITLGYITHERNKVWQTKLALWLDASQKSPAKSRPHNNLGNCYLLSGNYPAAAAAYRTAIRLDPLNIEPYYNLTLTLINLGQNEEATKVQRMFVNLVVKKSKETDKFSRVGK